MTYTAFAAQPMSATRTAEAVEALGHRFAAVDPSIEVEAVDGAYVQSPGEFAVIVVDCTCPGVFGDMLAELTALVAAGTCRVTRCAPGDFGWRIVLAA